MILLRINDFLINSVSRHNYESGHAHFKFSTKDNENMCSYLKDKLNKRIQLKYINERGKERIDRSLILTYVNCNEEVITINAEISSRNQ